VSGFPRLDFHGGGENVRVEHYQQRVGHSALQFVTCNSLLARRNCCIHEVFDAVTRQILDVVKADNAFWSITLIRGEVLHRLHLLRLMLSVRIFHDRTCLPTWYPIFRMLSLNIGFTWAALHYSLSKILRHFSCTCHAGIGKVQHI
jgi:hypothetical protein